MPSKKMPTEALNFRTSEHLKKRLKIGDKHFIENLLKNKERLFKVEPTDISGKVRDLHKPWGNLKIFQQKLNGVLVNIQLPDEFYGGIPERSQKKHAERHGDPKYVLNMDLANFFPSVKPEQVFRIFNKRLGCNKEISGILTELTTANDHLPQGFPTSMILSAFVLEDMVKELRRKLPQDLDLTIWVDDITISGNVDPSRKIALVKAIAKKYGFKIKGGKTVTCKRGVKVRKITGVTINNNSLSPKPGYTKQIEKMIEVLNRHGLEVLNNRYEKKYKSEAEARMKLMGKIGWIKAFKEPKAALLKKKVQKPVVTK